MSYSALIASLKLKMKSVKREEILGIMLLCQGILMP